MSRKIFLLSFIFLVIFAGSIFAGGIEIREVGARAGSLGTAFRAVADDPTTIFWNPAGLTQIKGQNVTAEASFIQVKAKVSQSYYNSGIISGYSTAKISQKKNWNLVPTIAYAGNINDKLKYGFGVYVQHGLGTEYDFFSDPVNYPTYPEYDWKSKGNFTSIHPALAAQINDRVSLGIGFFATRGSIEQRGILVSPGTGPLTGLDLPVDNFLKGDGWGYGGNVGVLCKANNEFTLGLTYRSSTKVDLSGDMQVNAYGPGLGIIAASSASSSTDMTLPANLGFGLLYNASEKLAISTDIDWTEWSSFDRSTITNSNISGALIGPASTVVYDWKNTIRYSLGLSYKLADNYNIYSGYYIDPSPVPDGTLTPWIPDSGTKQGFSFSLGYKKDNLELIAGYQHTAGISRTVTGNPQDLNGDGIVDNLPGNYSLQTGNIRLGANIIF